MAPVTTGLAMATAVTKTLHTMSSAKSVSEAVSEYGSQNSLTDLSKLARVQPITIIDSDCAHLEYLSDVLQTTLSIFTGYYLQAIAIIGTVDSVKVIKTLASVNPTSQGYRTESFSQEYAEQDGTWKQSMEAYKWSLPTKKNSIAFENASATLSKDDGVSEKLREAVNLGVGKIINVTLADSDKGTKVTMPVSISLATNILPPKAVQSIITLDNKDTTFIERFHYWRAGRIEFWRDLVLCQDMIDERKRLMMKDNSGVYNEIVSRSNSSITNSVINIIGAITGTAALKRTPTLATASNILIISDTTAKEVEAKLGGKLTNNNIRKNIFKSGYLMLIVVIDKQYERVTIYHRGIDLGSTMSLRDIKISNKGNGPDIMDIFKALGMGQAPTL